MKILVSLWLSKKFLVFIDINKDLIFMLFEVLSNTIHKLFYTYIWTQQHTVHYEMK